VIKELVDADYLENIDNSKLLSLSMFLHCLELHFVKNSEQLHLLSGQNI